MSPVTEWIRAIQSYVQSSNCGVYDRTIAGTRHGECLCVSIVALHAFVFSNAARDKSRRPASRLAIGNGHSACGTRSCRMRSRRRPKIQQIGRAASLNRGICRNESRRRRRRRFRRRDRAYERTRVFRLVSSDPSKPADCLPDFSHVFVDSRARHVYRDYFKLLYQFIKKKYRWLYVCVITKYFCIDF